MSSQKVIPSDIIVLHERFSNVLEDVMHIIGENPLIGRLFTHFVFSHEEKFTQTQLSEKLSVSISTISRNLKTMEDWKIVRKRLHRKPKESEDQSKKSDKWVYQEGRNPSLDLFQVINEKISENAGDLLEKKDSLFHLIENWESRSEEIKTSAEGIKFNNIVRTIFNLFIILEEEYETFLDRLEKRFNEVKL